MMGLVFCLRPFGGLVGGYNKNVRDSVLWRALWCLKDRVHIAQLGGTDANCGGGHCDYGSGQVARYRQSLDGVRQDASGSQLRVRHHLRELAIGKGEATCPQRALSLLLIASVVLGSAGRPERSATTRGTAPLRSTSSTIQRMSSARFGVMNVMRPGLIKEIIPSAWGWSVLHSGAIQKMGPSIFWAIIIARLRRLGPQASCTRRKVKWTLGHSSSVDV